MFFKMKTMAPTNTVFTVIFIASIFSKVIDQCSSQRAPATFVEHIIALSGESDHVGLSSGKAAIHKGKVLKVSTGLRFLDLFGDIIHETGDTVRPNKNNWAELALNRVRHTSDKMQIIYDSSDSPKNKIQKSDAVIDSLVDEGYSLIEEAHRRQQQTIIAKPARGCIGSFCSRTQQSVTIDVAEIGKKPLELTLNEKYILTTIQEALNINDQINKFRIIDLRSETLSEVSNLIYNEHFQSSKNIYFNIKAGEYMYEIIHTSKHLGSIFTKNPDASVAELKLLFEQHLPIKTLKTAKAREIYQSILDKMERNTKRSAVYNDLTLVSTTGTKKALSAVNSLLIDLGITPAQLIADINISGMQRILIEAYARNHNVEKLALIRGLLNGKGNIQASLSGRAVDLHVNLLTTKHGGTRAVKFVQPKYLRQFDYDAGGCKAFCILFAAAEDKLNFFNSYKHEVYKPRKVNGYLSPDLKSKMDKLSSTVRYIYGESTNTDSPFYAEMKKHNEHNPKLDIQDIVTSLKHNEVAVIKTQNHAMSVAFEQSDSGNTFLFFEPNSGVYVFSDETKFKVALTEFFELTKEPYKIEFDYTQKKLIFNVEYINRELADYINTYKFETKVNSNKRLTIHETRRLIEHGSAVAAEIQMRNDVEITDHANTMISELIPEMSRLNADLNDHIMDIGFQGQRSTDVLVINKYTKIKNIVQIATPRLKRAIKFVKKTSASIKSKLSGFKSGIKNFGLEGVGHGLSIFGIVMRSIQISNVPDQNRTTLDLAVYGFAATSLGIESASLINDVAQITFRTIKHVRSTAMQALNAPTALTSGSKFIKYGAKLNKFFSAVSIFTNLVGVVFDSIELHVARGNNDYKKIASSAIGLTGGLVGLPLGALGLYGSIKAVALASTVAGVGGLALAIVLLPIGFLVPGWIENREASKYYIVNVLGAIHKDLESPYLISDNNRLEFKTLTPISSIDLRQGPNIKYCLGEVHIQGNDFNGWFEGGKPWPISELVGLRNGFSIPECREIQYPSIKNLYLPTAPDSILTWDMHYTSTDFGSSDFPYQQLYDLYYKSGKKFTYHSGFWTVTDIKYNFYPSICTIQLSSSYEQNLIIQDSEAYPNSSAGKGTYNNVYKLQGCGGIYNVELGGKTEGDITLEISETCATKSKWKLSVSSPNRHIKDLEPLFQSNSLYFKNGNGKNIFINFTESSKNADIVFQNHLYEFYSMVFNPDIKLILQFISIDWIRNRGYGRVFQDLENLCNKSSVTKLQIVNCIFSIAISAITKQQLNGTGVFSSISNQIIHTTEDGRIYGGNVTNEHYIIELNTFHGVRLDMMGSDIPALFPLLTNISTSHKVDSFGVIMIKPSHTLQGAYDASSNSINFFAERGFITRVNSHGSKISSISIDFLNSFPGSNLTSKIYNLDKKLTTFTELSFLNDVELAVHLKITGVYRDYAEMNIALWFDTFTDTFIVAPNLNADYCHIVGQIDEAVLLFDTETLSLNYVLKESNYTDIDYLKKAEYAEQVCIEIGKLTSAESVDNQFFVSNVKGAVYEVNNELECVLFAIEPDSSVSMENVLQDTNNEYDALNTIIFNIDGISKSRKVRSIIHVESKTTYNTSFSDLSTKSDYIGYEANNGTLYMFENGQIVSYNKDNNESEIFTSCRGVLRTEKAVALLGLADGKYPIMSGITIFQIIFTDTAMNTSLPNRTDAKKIIIGFDPVSDFQKFELRLECESIEFVKEIYVIEGNDVLIPMQAYNLAIVESIFLHDRRNVTIVCNDNSNETLDLITQHKQRFPYPYAELY